MKEAKAAFYPSLTASIDKQWFDMETHDGKSLNITFAMLTFVVFSVVLCIYNKVVFAIFLLGSILYGGWMALFLHRRKVLDYELFEQQAINNNRTYEFITSMQEIKLRIMSLWSE